LVILEKSLRVALSLIPRSLVIINSHTSTSVSLIFFPSLNLIFNALPSSNTVRLSGDNAVNVVALLALHQTIELKTTEKEFS